MLLNLTNLFYLIIFLTLLSLVSQRFHILMCLLRLEATLLSLAFSITYSTAQLSQLDLFYCIVILSFGACEAAVALAVLVSITRAFGRDTIKSVNINKC